MSARAGWQADDGFALLEALAAIVLMGLIVSSLAVITAQWLPAWKRIYDRVQRSDNLAIALDRAADDIAAAQFMPADTGSRNVLFEGENQVVTLLRRAIGPNMERGLELVRIGDAVDSSGPAVTRSRVAFAPGVHDVDPNSAPVVLLRRPFRMSFEFAGPDGIWRTDWQNQEVLPATVMLSVLDASGRRRLGRVVPVRVQLAPPEDCGGGACGSNGGDADQRDDRPMSMSYD